MVSICQNAAPCLNCYPFACTQVSCRVGKGASIAIPHHESLSCAVPTRSFRSSAPACNAWARRTIGIAAQKGRAMRLCPPYDSYQKKIGPCLRLWARGSPAFRFFRLPRDRGGRRADKAHCPDYSGRGVRITPDDEVHCCTPRLAARQRGILAFMPLTVVGPGRLLVADEAARVRPGDDGCVSLRSQVPLPAFKTPHECAPRRVDRDELHIG